MDGDEDDVERQVDHPAANAEQRLAIRADEHGNRRRGDGVLDQDRRAREKPAPRPECAAGKAIAAACGGDHRGQLGEGKTHAQVHRGHQQRGQEHPAPAALGQAEVPAGVVTGNDIGHAQAHQQDPACRAFFQFALLEIFGADFFEVDRGRCRLRVCMIAWHKGLPVFIVFWPCWSGAALGTGVLHTAGMQAGPPPSRASSLPQWICFNPGNELSTDPCGSELARDSHLKGEAG